MSTTAAFNDPPPPARAGFRWSARDAAFAAVAAAVAVVPFWPAAWYGFVDYDDGLFVLDQPHVRAGLTWESVRWAVGSTDFAYWVPVTWLSLQLDTTLFGADPVGYHRTNLALHAACAAAAYATLRRLGGAPGFALAAAAVWAVHPLRAESVVWVAERKGLLAALFGFLAVWAYARYADRPTAGRMAVVAAATFLSLASKPTVLTLPLGLLALDWWPLGRLARAAELGARLWEKWSLFALVAAFGVGGLVTQSRAGAVVEGAQAQSLPVRAGDAAVNTVIHLRQTVWPTGLGVLYPRTARPVGQGLAAGGLLAAITAAAVALRRRAPYVLAGWLWFVAGLLPVCGLLVGYGPHAYADRNTYWPQLGLIAAGVCGAAAAGRGRVPAAAGWAVAAGLIVALGGAARWQTGTWAATKLLWENAVAVAPAGNTMAFNNLGLEHEREGRLDDAAACFRRAVTEAELNFIPRANHARVLYASGRLDEAEAAAREAIEADAELTRIQARRKPTPGMLSVCWTIVGEAAARRGRPDVAAGAYRAALRYHPTRAARAGLGMALAEQGLSAEAVEVLAPVRAERVSAPAVNFALGAAYADLGDWAAALPPLKDAVRDDPGNPMHRAGLGMALLGAGCPAEAADQARAAAAAYPGWLPGWTATAWRMATDPNGRPDVAARAAALAVTATDPPTPQALDAAAAAAAAGGRFPEAVALAERAAAAAGRPDLAAAIRGRIDLYRAGRPYREPPPAP